jgi:hypothetical protein
MKRMTDGTWSLGRAAPRRRVRGSILVEFGLVCLAFYLLIAGTITFGSILHSAHSAQDVARIAARELAVAPLPATWTFDQALGSTQVRSSVYDPHLLVIDVDEVPGGMDLDAYLASLPTVNRAMRPLMIYDVVRIDGSAPRRLLRMPGALLGDPEAPSGLTGPFSVASSAPDRGLAAVRVNVPVQSSAMGSFELRADPSTPNIGSPNVADDAGVTEADDAPGGKVSAAGIPGFRTYDGPFGMGRVLLAGKVVRPYRRVVTAQAFFRREAFAEQSQ